MGDHQLRSSLSASLVLHLVLLILGGALVWNRAAHRDSNELNSKQLVWLTPEDLPKKTEDSTLAEEQRVVQTRAQEQAKVRDPKAKVYRGERDQVVERETVSKRQLTQQATRPLAGSPNQPRSRAERNHSQPKVPALSDLGLRFQKARAMKPEDNLSDQPQDSRRWAILPGVGEGVPQDYIHGLKESENTALNTREYVFFGYFQRIREKLDRAWASRLREQVEKVYRRGRQLASNYEYTTRTVVTLNPQGAIVRVRLMEASGAMDLDDAAIQAFNEAGPFPNPPTGLLGQSQEVEIRWDFVVRN